MIKTMVAKLLTAKVAAAAAAVFAVGGVATAAATGALPLTAGGGGSAPAPAASSHAQPPANSAVTSTKTHAPDATRPEHQPAPAPSLAGLCHAYSAGDKAEHGKALESPAFAALIAAAGDKAKVDGYCGTLLAEEASTPAHTTGSPGAPADPGNSNNSDNGKSHPSGPPSTHPSGPPATRPTH